MCESAPAGSSFLCVVESGYRRPGCPLARAVQDIRRCLLADAGGGGECTNTDASERVRVDERFVAVAAKFNDLFLVGGDGGGCCGGAGEGFRLCGLAFECRGGHEAIVTHETQTVNWVDSKHPRMVYLDCQLG